MAIPEEVINEIISSVNIVDVVGRYVRLERRGNRHWGLSPFKTEKTPSFSVSAEKGVYYCFSTSKGGGIVNFLREVEHLDFIEALHYLAEMSGLSHLLVDKKSPHSDASGVSKEILARLTKSFVHMLIHHPSAEAARNYLVERGITEAAVEHFSLGFAPQDQGWVYRILKKHNFSDAVIFQTGIFSERRNFLFNGRIIFPIYSAQGDVIAFGGRDIVGREPKYLNSRDSHLFKKKRALYGLSQAVSAIRKERKVFLVEGYFDVIAMQMADVPNTVATLGTALSKEHLLLLRRYADKVIFVYDSDEAGSKAALRSGMLAEQLEFPAEVVVLPEGRDPADFLSMKQTEQLKSMLQDPVTMFRFVLNYYRGVDTEKNMSERAKNIFEYISAVPSEIERQGYLFELADELGLDKHLVTKDFQGYNKPSFPVETEKKPHVHLEKTVDLMLMLTLFRRPDLFIAHRGRIVYDSMQDKQARELFCLLEDSFRMGELDASDWNILHRVESEELRNYVAAALHSEEFENEEGIINNALFRMSLRKCKEERRVLEREIRKLDQSDDTNDISFRNLLADKQDKDKEIDRLMQSKEQK